MDRFYKLNKYTGYRSFFGKKDFIKRVWVKLGESNNKLTDALIPISKDIVYIEFVNLFPTFSTIKELEMELKMITRSDCIISPVYNAFNLSDLNLNISNLVYERI